MFNILFNQVKKWRTKGHTPSSVSSDQLSTSDTKDQDEEDIVISDPALAEMLHTACAQFSFYIREDGEFAITSEFSRSNEEVVDIVSIVLHMLNSGLMAEYFMKSLKLWGLNKNEQKFILEIIQKWKELYEEDEMEKDREKAQYNLAVDPSEVFGLKALKDNKS